MVEKKIMVTTTTVSVFQNAISLRYGAIAIMGLPQNIAGHEHGRSCQSTLAILFPSLRIGTSRTFFSVDNNFRKTAPVRMAYGARLCGIQWNCEEDSDEVLSASDALKRVLTVMFEAINANGVFDRVSEEKIQRFV